MKLKTLCIAMAVSAAFTLTSAHAQETPPPAPAGGHQMGGMPGGMGGMGAMMMSDENLKQKQEHLLKMHELSGKILAATDAKEKDRLKAEQLQLMKEHEKQHHQMMQQHMQEMMKNKGGMPGMQHGGAGGGMGNMGGGMGNMQHGNGAAAPATPAAPMAH
jgi:hypothetical protein